ESFFKKPSTRKFELFRHFAGNGILISVFRKLSLPGGKTMTVKFPEVWDLDVLFQGGSDSKELRLHMDEATPKLNEFEKTAQRFKAPTSSGDAEMVANLLEEVNALMQHLSQSGSFIGCLMSQNTEDKKAAI